MCIRTNPFVIKPLLVEKSLLCVFECSVRFFILSDKIAACTLGDPLSFLSLPKLSISLLFLSFVIDIKTSPLHTLKTFFGNKIPLSFKQIAIGFLLKLVKNNLLSLFFSKIVKNSLINQLFYFYFLSF
jgi:hypothetical protein